MNLQFSTDFKAFLFFLENERLKRELAALNEKYKSLERRSARTIRRLEGEAAFLAEINAEFGRENDELQSQIDRYASYRLPKSLQRKKIIGETNDDGPSTKRRKTEKEAKSKGKKPVRIDDELGNNSANSNSEANEPVAAENDERGARVWFLVFYIIFPIFLRFISYSH